MPTSSASSKPALAINFGTSSTTFLYASEGAESIVYNFPFAYSKNLYGNYISEAKFNLESLKSACKALKISRKDCEVYATSFPNLINIEYDFKLFNTLDKVLIEESEYNCIYLESLKIVSNKDSYYEYFESEHKSHPKLEDINQLSNICLYPQIVYEDVIKRFVVDNELRYYSDSIVDKIDQNRPIIFTGPSFQSYTDKSAYLNIILALNFLKKPGSYEIKIDEQNVYANMALLSSAGLSSTIKIPALGTLINSPGFTECLVESDYGTSQLLTIEKDKLYVLQLEENSTARVVVKGNPLGNVEKTISGGKLGLIIDTRDKLDPKTYTQEYFEKNYNTWISVLKVVLEGLYVHTDA